MQYYYKLIYVLDGKTLSYITFANSKDIDNIVNKFLKSENAKKVKLERIEEYEAQNYLSGLPQR